MNSTVPNAKLSQIPDVRWLVLPDRFPLPPGQSIGEVNAPNRELAQQKAEDHYGRAVVVTRAVRKVEPETSTFADRPKEPSNGD